MIARGDFREDLYYRLNGLVVRLPALRERTDFDLVVNKILASLCDKGQHVRIAEDVMALFRGYHWPGNFRQLHNLLRTAVVMVGPAGAIQRIHLPDDFLAELRPVVPTAAVRVDRMGSGVDPAFAYPDASPSLVARDTEGGSLQELALWWERFQQVEDHERVQLINQLGKDGIDKGPRRRRNYKRKRTSE